MTIAKEIELEDHYENLGAQLAKEVATKTNDVAGDGTTTATVLAQALVHEGLRNVAAGANPMGLKRRAWKATEAVAEAIRNQAREIESQEEIASVAAIWPRTPRSARPSPRPWTRSARTGSSPSTSRRPSA